MIVLGVVVVLVVVLLVERLRVVFLVVILQHVILPPACPQECLRLGRGDPEAGLQAARTSGIRQ